MVVYSVPRVINLRTKVLKDRQGLYVRAIGMGPWDMGLRKVKQLQQRRRRSFRIIQDS